MDILSYVQELLQQQASVSLTGLGTFYKKKSAGRYDKEKKSFLPPSYVLEFSVDENEDPALANFISKQKNISSDSANYFIAEFVKKTNEKLELEHEADLNNIGRLYYTEHDGLSFDPSKNIILGSEFFGLPEIPASPIDLIEETKPETEEHITYEEIAEVPVYESTKEEIDSTPTIEPIIENVELDEVNDDLKNTLKHTKEETAPVIEPVKTYVNLEGEPIKTEKVVEAPDFIKEQHAEYPKRFGNDPSDAEPIYEETKPAVWPKVLWAVLALAVIAGVLYFAMPNLLNKVDNQPEVNTAPVVDSSALKIDSAKIAQDSIAKTDSILRTLKVNPIKADTAKKVKPTETATVATPPTTTVNTPAGKITYDVIAASFKTTGKAELFVKQMKAYGLNAKIVELPGRLKKVSIGSFATEKEAFEKRPELAKKINIKDLDIIQINTAL